MRRYLWLAAALAVLGGAPFLAPGDAFAHERRTVAAKYQFVVGFITEPALIEEPNGIDLRITDAATNAPVEGVEKTLKADIIVGGQTKTVDLRARFGQPGAYTADIVPTKTGTWVFRFHGTIDGTPVDERFESGPGRFGDVEAKSALQFPAKVPSLGELAAQVSPADGQGAPQSMEAAKALNRADDARTLALLLGGGGIAVGVLGLAVGAYALTSRRSGGEPA